MKTTTIAAVQMLNQVGGAAINAKRTCTWMERAHKAGASLVIFPECNLTGYTTGNPESAAISLSDDAVCAVESCARELGISVGFGLIESCASDADGTSSEEASEQLGAMRPFATYVVFVGRAAQQQTNDAPGHATACDRLVYRKTHLGQRESSFAAGDALPVQNIGGIQVGVQLCWESHIPDIAATLRHQGCQLLLTPYAMGMDAGSRLTSWSRYLPARAFDNGIYVVACNALFAKDDGSITGGGTACWKPNGELLGSYTQSDEHMALFSIEGPLPREHAQKNMREISYFDRRRPELYRTH